MSKVYRVNRKATDEDIIKMNAVGLSLATIAKTLGIHPTTVNLPTLVGRSWRMY